MKEDYFRRSPRKIWYENIKEIVANGDHEVTFVLEKPQPSLLAMLASGLAPVIPCHLSAKDLRTNPVGTGPFKFVDYKSNDSIKLVKNPELLEEGHAVPRRHRLAHRREPLDARAGLRRR